jgi:ketosteroid isomerase-like protein
MRNSLLLRFAFLISFSLLLNAGSAQNANDKVKKEITEALKLFNTTAQNANTDQMMSLFDDSENIMFTGSDSAEIWKGREQIRGHLNSIFQNEKVSLEMNRIDIDYIDNIAWVFVDGAIIISPVTGETIKAPYRFTGIMVKKHNNWKWRMFSGSSPAGK